MISTLDQDFREVASILPIYTQHQGGLHGELGSIRRGSNTEHVFKHVSRDLRVRDLRIRDSPPSQP